ncbi:alpha-L-fucosidase [bacterium A37T11]|nr:alpha-L-fucosidase [bacterium A37T11]
MKLTVKRSQVLIALLLCTLSNQWGYGQKKNDAETIEHRNQRMQWWTNDRFGMFIHFGLYSLAARGEWVKNIERMTNEQYQTYFNRFNPDKLAIREWMQHAKEAGMKYVVLTTKHHEGFCLFDSKYTDYKVTNTPYKKDIIAEYVAAAREAGLKVGFYYSLIDWHHPDFTIDWLHPQRPGNDSLYASLNRGKDMNRYRLYLYNQVQELLTNYGKIDILWLDMSYGEATGKGRKDWDSPHLVQMIRRLQPQIILNDRMELGQNEGGADFETPEQVGPDELTKYKGKYFETCQTFSGLWGYSRDENTWKNTRQLLDILISSVANGGNLILNVGPTGRGSFDPRALNALHAMGAWMNENSQSIYGCGSAPADFIAPPGTKLTYNKELHKLYIHLFEYPWTGTLAFQNFGGKVTYAQFLHDYSQLVISPHQPNDNKIKLILPKEKPAVEIPVIELTLK